MRARRLVAVAEVTNAKLAAVDTTGDIPAAVKLRAKLPVGLIAVMHLPNFGPKRARRLYDELGVDSLESLRAAAEDGRIRGLRGFGKKVEDNLLDVLAAGSDGSPAPRILLSRALGIGEQVLAALQGHGAAERVELAGSLRRMTDSVKDLDVVTTSSDPT